MVKQKVELIFSFNILRMNSLTFPLWFSLSPSLPFLCVEAGDDEDDEENEEMDEDDDRHDHDDKFDGAGGNNRGAGSEEVNKEEQDEEADILSDSNQMGRANKANSRLATGNLSSSRSPVCELNDFLVTDPLGKQLLGF